MTPKQSIVAVAASLALLACGSEEPTAPESAAESMSGTEDGAHSSGNTGNARGTVVSVADGELGIDHGPIEGIGMGAMTMLFGMVGGLDASTFEEGDEVAFTVKRGRDGVYRITAICDTAQEGENCLTGGAAERR